MANSVEMGSELSVSDLESELCAELPERNLMRRCRRRRHHHHHANGGISASHGSAVNSNRTNQVNFNPQVVVNTGTGNVDLHSHNTNNNTNTQTAVPINFSI